MISACEKGHLDDVKLLITGHDVNATGVTLKEMVNQVGNNSYGIGSTALSPILDDNWKHEIKR